MIKKIYAWLYKATARSDERGESFGGYVQGAVRAKTLETLGAPSGKVLEIGSGSGLFLMKLAIQNPALEAYGVDTADGLVEQVKEKARARGIANLQLSCQSGAKVSFADGYFDIVVCINLFLDMNKDGVIAVLKEMKRVCKPSGRIIFEFRNARNALFRLKYRLARYYDPSAPYPLYTYYPEDIDRILDELGLAVVLKEYMGFPIKRFAPIIIVEVRKR